MRLRPTLLAPCVLVLASCEDTESSDRIATASIAPAKGAALSAARPEAPPADDLGPAITLDGASHGHPSTVIRSGPRIYSRALRTWIHKEPRRDAEKLGYLRAGSSSPTSATPAGHDGCKKGWYPVEPRGFVCVGRKATLNGDDPIVVATLEFPPDLSAKLPYIYGTVRRPGPRYLRLPSDEEMEQAEPGVAKRMQSWLEAGGEIGASYAQHVWVRGATPADPSEAWTNKTTAGVPSLLAEGKPTPNIYTSPRPEGLTLGTMGSRVGHSFLSTFLHRGRRFGLTTDLRLLPTDRLRPIQGSDFRGVEIGKEVDYPFAFVRHPNAKLYVYQASSDRLVLPEDAPYRSVLKLSGKQQFFDGRLHYETEDGKYISDLHASRLDPAKRMPGWAKNGEKWIDISLARQVLTLYEGETPVYATLVSTGEAGLADADTTTATRRGIFRVHTKHITATMSSDQVGEEFELRDVPYVQYFEDSGYALHGAYWHDRFGMPKSHGCINLSPEDARRIFYWTEPKMPVGWHGVLLPLKGTVLFIHD